MATSGESTRTSTSSVGPSTAGTSRASAYRDSPLSIDLLTEATKLWGLYRVGDIDYDKLDRMLVRLEQRYGASQTLCAVCERRHAAIWEQGRPPTCAQPDCIAAARFGDEIDRGWSEYKDATDG